LLDSLVGEWHVTGVVRATKKTEKVVRAAWVLNHQFVELHYRDLATPSTYEAIVYIGRDGPATYIAHWVDVFGGKMSARGRGSRDGNAIEFAFDYPDGPFYNTYTFDPGAQSWTSLMRTKDSDGKWAVFAEEHFRR
jgi:hypothetical protein